MIFAWAPTSPSSPSNPGRQPWQGGTQRDLNSILICSQWTVWQHFRSPETGGGRPESQPGGGMVFSAYAPKVSALVIGATFNLISTPCFSRRRQIQMSFGLPARRWGLGGNQIEGEHAYPFGSGRWNINNWDSRPIRWLKVACMRGGQRGAGWDSKPSQDKEKQ